MERLNWKYRAANSRHAASSVKSKVKKKLLLGVKTWDGDTFRNRFFSKVSQVNVAEQDHFEFYNTDKHTHLENKNIRVPVRPLPAAVDGDVFEPLDVGLRVTEHSAHEGHVAADHRRLIGRQARLQDGPVG